MCRQPAERAQDLYLRTAHKLATNSSGASHRLAPVLDPDQLYRFGLDIFCKQTWRPAIKFVLNVLQRPKELSNQDLDNVLANYVVVTKLYQN